MLRDCRVGRPIDTGAAAEQFRTREVKVVIRRDKLTVDFAASILGKPERVNFHSLLVDETRNLSLKFDPSRYGGREFFGIG